MIYNGLFAKKHFMFPLDTFVGRSCCFRAPEKLVEPLAPITKVYLEVVYVDIIIIKKIMLRYKYTERSKKLINSFTIKIARSTCLLIVVKMKPCKFDTEISQNDTNSMEVVMQQVEIIRGI